MTETADQDVMVWDVTLTKMRAYSGEGRFVTPVNVHTHESEAEIAGIPHPVAQGHQVHARAVEMARDLGMVMPFRSHARFRNLTKAGDRVEYTFQISGRGRHMSWTARIQGRTVAEGEVVANLKERENPS